MSYSGLCTRLWLCGISKKGHNPWPVLCSMVSSTLVRHRAHDLEIMGYKVLVLQRGLGSKYSSSVQQELFAMVPMHLFNQTTLCNYSKGIGIP